MGLLEYIRGLMGWQEDEIRETTLKRDRDFSDDDPPIMKRYKTVKSHFPKIVMPSDEEEGWTELQRIRREPREYYIPVIRDGAPSTSTPAMRSSPANLPSTSSGSRGWNLNSESTEKKILLRPDISNISNNSLGAMSHRPSQSSALQEIFLKVHCRDKVRNNSDSLRAHHYEEIPLDNDDDDDDIFIVKEPEQPKEPQYYKKNQKSIMNHKEQNEIVEVPDDDDEFDVMFVKRYKSPRSLNTDRENIENSRKSSYLKLSEPMERLAATKFFKAKGSDIHQHIIHRSSSPKLSQNSHTRFKAPLVLSKPKILRSEEVSKAQSNLSARKLFKRPSFKQFSESTRAAIVSSFRLDDKKKYEELIKQSTLNFSPRYLKSFPKPAQLDLTEAHSLISRSSYLNDSLSSTLKLNMQKDINLNGTSENHKDEYDSITVASINLYDSDPEVVTSADDGSTTSSIQIAPINSMKILLKDKPHAKKDWISDLTKKYKTMRLEKRSQVEDCAYQTNLIGKFNREQWKSTLEKTVKANMRLPINIIEQAIEDDDLLPELTEEQEAMIDNALRPNPPHQQLIQKFNITIHRRDINSLHGLNWLNDEVINFYVNLIVERSQQKTDLPKVYGMNTFFFPKLRDHGFSSLKRWTKKVDIFSHDLIIVPVHLGLHWCMSIIDFRNKTIKYYDSMGATNNLCLDLLQSFLVEESMDKKKEKFDTTKWEKESVEKIPQQMNGSDCGMFSCTFAEFASRNAPFSFSQENMPYLRRKMVLEIVQGQLLM